MSYRTRANLAQGELLTPAAFLKRKNYGERTFGLHPMLFVATIGCYLLFLALLGAAFMNPALVIPFAIFFIYIAMAFGTPAMWARVTSGPKNRTQSWAEFRAEGMDIQTGHVGSTAAMAQILVLPALLVGFAAAVVLVAALV